MTKQSFKKIKEKLEKEKIALEKELESFAKKDEKLKDDWDSKFPKFNGGSGGRPPEDAADEVEEYATRLPIEHSLELKLRDVNLALKKIAEGTYGNCEKCGKSISFERLEAYPEAKTCLECKS